MDTPSYPKTRKDKKPMVKLITVSTSLPEKGNPIKGLKSKNPYCLNVNALLEGNITLARQVFNM